MKKNKRGNQNFFLHIPKKGVSPVIATILLVGIVIMMGIIIFLWFKNLQKEAITKFGDTNIELVCDEVSFDASYSSGQLYLLNTGNVPIYSFKVKTSEEGSYKTENIEDLTQWPKGLNEGRTFSSQINLDANAEEIKLIPVLLGNSKKGHKSFVCGEQYGVTL
jgi:flagellin-like protein